MAIILAHLYIILGIVADPMNNYTVLENVVTLTSSDDQCIYNTREHITSKDGFENACQISDSPVTYSCHS